MHVTTFGEQFRHFERDCLPQTFAKGNTQLTNIVIFILKKIIRDMSVRKKLSVRLNGSVFINHLCVSDPFNSKKQLFVV